MKLRQYQKDSIINLRKSIASGNRKPILQMPCGGGKTIVAAQIIKMATEKENSVLFIAPRRELILQAQKQFFAHGIRSGIIMAGIMPSSTHSVQIASKDTLYIRGIKNQRIAMPRADIVIADECFVAGTFVDGMKIETIKVGDVLSTGTVVAVSKKRARKLVHIKFNNNMSITCTEGHPLLSPSGWVDAGDLKLHNEVVTTYGDHHEYNQSNIKNLHELRNIFSTSEETAKKNVYERLFNCVEEKQRACKPISLRTNKSKRNEGEQSHETPRRASEGQHNITCNGMEACCSLREWLWTYCARKINCLCIRLGYECRRENKTSKRFWLSNMLQNRCRKQRIKNRNRGRWKQSLCIKKKRKGQKEESVFRISRVESIKVYEQGNRQEFRKVCKDGYVYNLEIRKSNIYIANGVVVHNCHLSISPTWMTVLKHYEKSVIIGLTATPARGDGLGLGKMYDDLILSWPAKKMVDHGYLVPVRYYSHKEKINLSGVKKGADGDYQVKSLAPRVDKPKLIGDIVSNWQRIAPGKSTVVFATNCAHSRHIRDQFIGAGVKAEHVDGETPPDERKQIFDRVRSGETTVLCNVFVASYGLDIPRLEVAVIARPTKNITLWFQTGGRVLRPFPGKTEAIIIDHANVIEEHGFLDEYVPWSLDGKTSVSERKKAIEKGEPKEIVCNYCGCVFKNSRICPDCGTQLIPKNKPIPTKHADLVEVIKKQSVKDPNNEPWETKINTMGMLKWYQKKHKLKDGWVSHKYRELFGVWPNDKRLRTATPLAPDKKMENWITHQNIRYANRRAA